MLTKQEFEEAYRKFPPGKCEMFFLKYFSIHSLRDNKWLAVTVSLLLILPLVFELLFNLLHFCAALMFLPSCVYIVLLGLAGGFWLKIWFKKKSRLEKIRKYLNVTEKDYQDLITAYYYHRYPSAKAFISHNSKIK